MDWRHDAICRDEDPELFFPTGEEHTTGQGPSRPTVLQNAEAKAVCRRCPVVSDCLAWALDEGLPFGVAGGTTADERRAMHVPRRRIVPPPTRGRGRPRRRT